MLFYITLCVSDLVTSGWGCILDDRSTCAPAPLVAAATTGLSVAVVVALEAVVVVGVVMSTVGATEDTVSLLHICVPFLQQPVSRARSHL